jgi:hypothetical protein
MARQLRFAVDVDARVLGHHEDRTPTHGYEATREAALIAMHECAAYIPDMSSPDFQRALHRQRQARYGTGKM